MILEETSNVSGSFSCKVKLQGCSNFWFSFRELTIIVILCLNLTIFCNDTKFMMPVKCLMLSICMKFFHFFLLLYQLVSSCSDCGAKILDAFPDTTLLWKLLRETIIITKTFSTCTEKCQKMQLL